MFKFRRFGHIRKTDEELDLAIRRQFEQRRIAKGDWHVKETYRIGEDGIKRGPYYAIQRRNHSGRVEVVYVGRKITKFDLSVINEIWGGNNRHIPTGADIRVLLG